ncbi:MAG TPA: hypothetical protein VK994_00235, partial [Bacteroidales bacterium]|nr:hypothetical protein [Bacteroidales bacterium]
VAIAVLLLTISAGMPENDFRILKSRNGIDLYYRWMDMPGGNRVRQMKAVLNVDANTEDVITLLKDEERALHWISSAEKFQHLDTASLDEWVSYIQFSVPWPLADQDCILEFTRKVKANGEVLVEFKCNPGYITEVDGMKRMTDINGCFVLKPCDKGDCILECYFLSSKASVIPRWITEPIITGNILNMMEALRDELNEV